MAAKILIPRFLLPQSSWKLAGSAATAAVRPIPRSARPLSSQTNQSNPSSNFRRPTLDNYHGCPRISQNILHQCRAFSKTQNLARDHHFDTLKFVQRLKDEGFSEEQSKAMMLVLSDVIEESIQNLTRTMVLREGRFLLIPIWLAPSTDPTTSSPQLTLSTNQTPTAAPTRKKSTSQSSAPSSSRRTQARHPQPPPPTSAYPTISRSSPLASGTRSAGRKRA